MSREKPSDPFSLQLLTYCILQVSPQQFQQQLARQQQQAQLPPQQQAQLPPQPQPAPQPAQPQPAKRGPGRPRRKSSPNKTGQIPNNKMSANNPAVTHHPNTDTGNQQPATAVDPG